MIDGIGTFSKVLKNFSYQFPAWHSESRFYFERHRGKMAKSDSSNVGREFDTALV